MIISAMQSGCCRRFINLVNAGLGHPIIFASLRLIDSYKVEVSWSASKFKVTDSSLKLRNL